MKLGIIGGSGLYEIDGIENLGNETINTPFGHPSDDYVTGTLNGADAVFLPRHGKGHTILPGEINHKANIYGMKKLGVTHILSVSAVGSLKEELPPRDVVIVDQFFDRTKKGLDHTFFGNGIAGHIGFGNPVCGEFAKVTFQAAQEAAKEINDPGHTPTIHMGGTYVNMEGPAFSTKAESLVYRSFGHDVIGMTNLAEAKLAREAEMCYCSAAMVTDFDCWHPDHDHVTVDLIIENFQANVLLGKKIISHVASSHAEFKEDCACHRALAGAIITSPERITWKIRERLAPIIGKYFPMKNAEALD